MQPDSTPTSFLTLEPGTEVVDRFGAHVGEVHHVLVLETGGFDRVVVRTRAGKRFVDAPEVRRISQGAVTLGITVEEVEHASPGARRIYGVPFDRHDRTDVTEADRDEVVDCLKRAYVRDELTTDQLSDRVGIAHTAETLDQLDTALADVSIS
jgi:hypothetical protein